MKSELHQEVRGSGRAMASGRRATARLSAALLLVAAGAAPGWAAAQGFTRSFENLGTFASQVIHFLVLLGMLAGTGMVLGGIYAAYRKYDARNEDTGWGKISLQICAGGLAMALAWVGTNVVETVGGSRSDIGAAVKKSH